MQEIDEKSLKKLLQIDAHAVGIPTGAANVFIDRTIKDAIKSLKHKTLITDKDLTRAITKELKKYNADLAYVYQNHDKII